MILLLAARVGRLTVDTEGLATSPCSLIILATQPQPYLRVSAHSEALRSVPWIHLLQPLADGYQDFHFIAKSLVRI